MRPPRTPGAVPLARQIEHDDRNNEGPCHRQVRPSTTLTHSVVKSGKLSVLTFNCYCLKSSINDVTYMMKSLDIAFLCEHWLIESEIVRICDEVLNHIVFT